MTNYEWLVHNGRLDGFIERLQIKDREELLKMYSIPYGTHKYVIKTETYFDTSEELYQIKSVEYNDDVAQLFKDTTVYNTLDEARAALIKIIEGKIETNV